MCVLPLPSILTTGNYGSELGCYRSNMPSNNLFGKQIGINLTVMFAQGYRSKVLELSYVLA